MSDYVEGKSRWWGWGDLDQGFDIEKRENIIPFMQESLGVDLARERFSDPDLDEIDLPAPRIGEEVVEELRGICGPDNVSSGKFHRVSRSMGKSYRDTLRFRMRRIDRPTDVVAWPREEREIVEILRLAEKKNLEVIPFGGGSSVTGGVEPRAAGRNGVLTLDMARLNRVIRVDATSQTAVIQAGALGPEIEEQLNAHGYTLGHFPESFDHSTLGGWIATRASGCRSTGYGDIEDMVLALRMVTPRGVIDTRKVPSTAAGPSILQLCIGCEGYLGIITEATMRIRPAPEIMDYRGLIFRSFAAGVSAIREMIQQGMVPTCVRLSDRTETALAQAFRSTAGNRWKRKAEDAALGLLARRGYSFDDGAFMVLGLEGEREEVEYLRAGILRLCRRHGGLHLGMGPGRQWYRSQHATAYFREQLINWGILVDTVETATTWDNLLHLYGEVRSALSDALEEDGGKSMVMCHVSHSYREGCSLYYTFFAPMLGEGGEEEQWERVKRAASEAMMEYGGTITHHHGIGYEHAPWMRQEVGDISIEVMQAVKETVDPAHILNPGKLLPGG